MADSPPLLGRLKRRFAKARPALLRKNAEQLKGTLIARGLTKSYKGRQVVSGVSLGLRAGEAGRESSGGGRRHPGLLL